MLWLLEPDIYAAGPHPLKRAVVDAGHRYLAWEDDWWGSGQFPTLEGPVLFHGSLGNAARIAELDRWVPGAFCDTSAFHCSRWYAEAREWLVHGDFVFSTVEELAADPVQIAGALADASGEVFVRPDSPLKPFSGRVVKLEGLTPGHLDHGFYYEDLGLPVVISPKQTLGAEWRIVICNGAVVCGCRYQADGRTAAEPGIKPEVADLAKTICADFPAPDPVFVLDIVEAEAGLKMVEINPFSGADLYSCDSAKLVADIASFVAGGS